MPCHYTHIMQCLPTKPRWNTQKRCIKKTNIHLNLRLSSHFTTTLTISMRWRKISGLSLKKNMTRSLFSYHSIPRRHITKGDITGSHCLKTPIAAKCASPAHKQCYRHQCVDNYQADCTKPLDIPGEKYGISFQSRLGREEWLKPYTALRLAELPATGVKKLLVVCPSFVSDCLETLEEMAVEGKEIFLHAGGESFELIPCLNTHPLLDPNHSGMDEKIHSGKQRNGSCLKGRLTEKENRLFILSDLMYEYVKALHIIFIVTWFSGMFYIVRLFIYNTEASEKSEPEKSILNRQFTIMIKRLWFGITWPSAMLTLIFGVWMLYLFGSVPAWLGIKIAFVAGLYLYHLSLHNIYSQQMKGRIQILQYSTSVVE